MALRNKYIQYNDGKDALEGYLAWDDEINHPKPGVLLVHAWAGRDSFVCRQADRIASLGYVSFALDLYGKGLIGKSKDENSRLMRPFIEDRSLLKRRLLLALSVLKNQNQVNSNKIASVGYCFGGLASLDLARHSVNLRGAVSLHGNLTPLDVTKNHKIDTKILVLHGWKDPMVPLDDVLIFTQEMTRSHADWQLQIFGNAMHAFTKPDADDTEHGMLYDELSEKRSWDAMRIFLAEIFA